VGTLTRTRARRQPADLPGRQGQPVSTDIDNDARAEIAVLRDQVGQLLKLVAVLSARLDAVVDRANAALVREVSGG